MKKIVIAIDGHSACGKSTTAKIVASRLGYAYIDTGAMYRAVTLYFDQHYIDFTNPIKIEKALEDIHITFLYNEKSRRNETCLNGINVEEEIRKMYISNKVSEVSAIPAVRHAMVEQQQRMGRKRGVVMDGRDIGTRVFPDAELKLFMTADRFTRAARRQKELLEKNQMVDLEEIIKNLEKRDHIDSTRTESPLIQSEDAYLMDTSHMHIDEQVEMVLQLATSRIMDMPGQVAENNVSEAK